MRIFKTILFFFLLLPVTVACNSSKPEINEDLYEVVGEEKNGFELNINFNNRSENLMVLNEWTPTKMVYLDSVRTNAEGKAAMSGKLEQGKICYLQFGPQEGVLLYLDNRTKMNLNISIDSNRRLAYNVTGENTVHTEEIKKVFTLNNNFYYRMMMIEQQAENAEASDMAMLRYNYQRLQQAKENALASHIENSPSGPSMYLALKLMQQPSLNTLKQTREFLGKEDKNSTYYKEIDGIYQSEMRTAVGSPAPEIELPDTSGTKTKLSALEGKVILIDFWASWCRPCRMANPEVVAMYNKYKDDGFEVFGVSLDNNKGSWKKAIEADSLTWTHVSDLRKWQSVAAKTYKVQAIPSTYLIDRNGNIAAKNLRGESLEAKIQELLAVE